MKPNKFKWRAPHHLYIGFFTIFMGWTMLSHWYYHPLAEITLLSGILITADDIIEHTVTARTPLRLLFEKVIVPALIKVKFITVNNKPDNKNRGD